MQLLFNKTYPEFFYKEQTGAFLLTWEVQVFQVGAAGHHLKHSLIRDVITAGHLQVAQLGAALSHHVEPPVGEPFAAIHHHRLQSQTHVRCVLAQPVGEDPDGAVHVQQLSC